MLTKESNEYISELKSKMKYNDLLNNSHLKEIFNKLELLEYDYDIPEINHKKGKYPCNEFMVKRLYDKSLKYRYINSLNWKTRSTYSVNISLNIYSNNSKEIDSKRINLLVYALSFICSLSNKNRNIKIHLVLLGDKKKYTGKFTRNEINTAGCKYDEYNSEICVWRIEECIKAIFHECIHSLGFSSIDDSNEIIKNYNKKYNTDCETILIDEAYTEIWSRIINCYFISKLTSFKEDNLDIYKYFCILLSIEREFSYLQANKISRDLIKSKKKHKCKETSIISYYIITAELFDNFDKFLNFCFRDKNPFYLKDNRLFNNFLLGLKKIPFKKLSEKNKSYKTMKMSAIELKI